MTRLTINSTISRSAPIGSTVAGHRAALNAGLHAIALRPCTLALSLLALCAWLISQDTDLVILSMSLTRESFLDGRLWTIMAGPLLHVSVQHLVFDVLGLLIVGWIFEPMLKRGMIFIVIATNIAVAIAAFAIYPQLDSYCGLSALDQGLLAAGAVALARNRNARPALVIAAVLSLKWLSELLFAQSSLGLISTDPARYGTPVPWCHLVGGMAGAVSASGWLAFKRRRQTTTQTRRGSS